MACVGEQSLRAAEFLVARLEVGFAFRHYGFRRRLLALALRYRAPRRLYGAIRHAKSGLGFPELGLKHVDVHVGDDLAGGDVIAFIHQLVNDAARDLRGHVDLRCLDASIGAGEAGTRAVGLHLRPEQPTTDPCRYYQHDSY